MSRAEIVRELVKDPSLRVTDIAKQTGYNKGHVSRLRKEAKGQHMIENKLAKTPADGGAGFIDGVWYRPGPTAWQCQCGKAYTVTCISSKPAKQLVGLTDEEIDALLPEADGTTEEVMRKVEYRPGLWADEVGIDDAWSKSLVIEIIRAVEKHHGIGAKR